MQEIFKLLIGVFILILGIPIGNILKKLTDDETVSGQKWFKLIISICLIGVIAGLFTGNDILLFSSAFIAIITSRNLIRNV